MITFKNNLDILNFGVDYHKIRSFLLKLNYPTFTFGRWDWMAAHGYLDKSGIPKIGVWEADGEIVALVTYDTSQQESYFCVMPEYRHLKREMAIYARDSIGTEDESNAVIDEGDFYFEEIASELGFVPTEGIERVAVYTIRDANDIHYTLPEGFRLTSMAESYDIFQYGQVLWRGFNHELNGEGPFELKAEDIGDYERNFKRPNVNLDLKIAVVAPNGDFVSYCGMWHDRETDMCLVEPVATDPAYRRMGLAKAAVLEGVKRCGLLGAKKAYVGSSQQFYYSIGFRPFITSVRWNMKLLK